MYGGRARGRGHPVAPRRCAPGAPDHGARASRRASRGRCPPQSLALEEPGDEGAPRPERPRRASRPAGRTRARHRCRAGSVARDGTEQEEFHRAAARTPAEQARAQRARLVAHEEVACGESLREVPHQAMPHGAAPPLEDEHARAVAWLDRCLGDACVGERVVEEGEFHRPWSGARGGTRGSFEGARLPTARARHSLSWAATSHRRAPLEAPRGGTKQSRRRGFRNPLA
jgi:hypothetical protein